MVNLYPFGIIKYGFIGFSEVRNSIFYSVVLDSFTFLLFLQLYQLVSVDADPSLVGGDVVDLIVAC